MMVYVYRVAAMYRVEVVDALGEKARLQAISAAQLGYVVAENPDCQWFAIDPQETRRPDEGE